VEDKEFLERIQQIRQRLYRIAYTYIKNEEDAKEIISNTVYKGYKNLSKLKNSEFFETWITSILINECHQVSRKNKGKVHVSLEFISDWMHKESEGNYDIDDRIDLYEAVDSLEGSIKTVIILKYLEDMTIKETAKHIGISESRVKNYIHKGLKCLREKLRGEING